jgi:hypothetical protein
MVTQKFLRAIWDFRRRGGKLYELAHQHHISPSLLSATLSGARRVNFDERLVAIGLQLGVPEDEIFDGDGEKDRVAS